MKLPRVLIAGAASGSGKTTVSLGLMAALQGRGLMVQPFKAGPDFIDASHHAQVCHVPPRNLDTWMCDDDLVQHVFQSAARAADISVIEGVMGLYDGFGPREDRGSTAYLAKLLRSPVILVIDAARTSSSAAAIALGFREYDRGVNLAGVVLNNVGSEGHYEWLRDSVEGIGIACLGYLRHKPEMSIPERHLGLVPSFERAPAREFQDELLRQIESGVGIDRIIRIARSAPSLPDTNLSFPRRPKRVTVAVARDRAFNFYYHEHLSLLTGLGAELVYFSPLEDSTLPEADALYIGGGFPEVFGRELGENRGMLKSIQRSAKRGLPIYGECGGLMYLCREIVDFEGRRHQMVGLVPASAVMSDRLSLGYIEVEALCDSLICRQGERLKAQTFHRSLLEDDDFQPCYRIRHSNGEALDGYSTENVLASYVHAYFPNTPSLASRLIDKALAYRAARGSSGG